MPNGSPWDLPECIQVMGNYTVAVMGTYAVAVMGTCPVAIMGIYAVVTSFGTCRVITVQTGGVSCCCRSASQCLVVLCALQNDPLVGTGPTVAEGREGMPSVWGRAGTESLRVGEGRDHCAASF